MTRKRYTLAEVADLLGVATTRVRHIYTRGLLPEPARRGRFRMVPASHVPRIRAELVQRGELPLSAIAAARQGVAP